MRACPDCGVQESRGVDANGRPTVNLSPITNQCVSCLVANRAKPMTDPEPFDARKAAAGDRE